MHVEYDQQQDVVYGYKDGMALVMDVYTPKESRNGAGIIWVAVGGWTPQLAWRRGIVSTPNLQSLLAAGYVVFVASHSSQPRYTVDDIRPDMPRAVRFIRHCAECFGVGPQRIGIIGSSSGGHVSLLTAIGPPSPDTDSEDPVDRASSEVQAVVAYCPPTDLLNYGSKNTTIQEYWHKTRILSEGFPESLGRWDAPFDFHRYDEEKQRFERVTDPDERHTYFRQNSPIIYVSATAPPVLLVHGDQDQIVPIQQSKVLVARLREENVPYKLIVAEGKGHGWDSPIDNELAEIKSWFGQHLLGNKD